MIGLRNCEIPDWLHKTTQGTRALQQFTIDFRDKNELREMWFKNFSTGTFFLPTARTFPLYEEFHLFLRIAGTETGVILRSRVIQILESGTQGMVGEFIDYLKFKPLLDSTIDDLKSKDLAQLLDFRDFKQKSAQKGTALPSEERLKNFFQEHKQSNYYDLLGVDQAASQKEIQSAYLKLKQEFDPELLGDQTDFSHTELLKSAYLKITRAFDVLTDATKKLQYDLASGKLVRARDESKVDFEVKRIQSARLKARGKNKENIEKAERIFAQALVSEKDGDLKAAIASIRIALQLDPPNMTYRQKLAELEKSQPGQSKVEHQKLVEQAQRSQEKAILRGKKTDDWTG